MTEDEDEDEVMEVQEFGGRIYEIPIGLDRAKQRARSRFLEGRIDAAEYEAEVDRLLRKEQNR